MVQSQQNMPAPVDRDSTTWARVWGALESALKSTPLPAHGGGTVTCGLDDFMLVGVDGSGNAHFKNTVTRNYLLIESSGALVIPTGAAFHQGFFAHLP